MTETVGITRRQAEALRFIGSYFASHGHSPTYVEICVGLGMSPKSKPAVMSRVLRLIDRGYLTSRAGHARSIALTTAGVNYCLNFPSPKAPSHSPTTTRVHFRRLEAES